MAGSLTKAGPALAHSGPARNRREARTEQLPRARILALTDAVAANYVARRAQVAELVDALVSGTSGASREGSSPFLGTNGTTISVVYTGLQLFPTPFPTGRRDGQL